MNHSYIVALNDGDQDHAFESISYLVPERKLGFFVKIKEDQNFNRRNTLSILRIKIFI